VGMMQQIQGREWYNRFMTKVVQHIMPAIYCRADRQ